MCGIAGFTTGEWRPDERRGCRAAARLASMVAALRHRGPDALRGVLLDGAALGHARLAIVDLAGGGQPMRDPDTGICITFNGEIFNYVELRDRLGGHRFRTASDTEVILAAYLRWGMACVTRFVGQWAFALWDPRTAMLHLSRDRFGVRPLVYAQTRDGVAFASEAKALFAGGFVVPRLDPLAIKETTCLWGPIAPRTAFEGVCMLPPGCNASIAARTVRIARYWDLDLDDRRVDASMTPQRARELVTASLDDAVRLRLRADVPVAAYLSGGLDSSLVCALAQRRLRHGGGSLSTFSVAFDQPIYDESAFQRKVASHLGTRHHEQRAAVAEIGRLMPETIRLAEQPLLRTAPAPLLALSGLVRDNHTKVVLTGEGADEFFWGYQIFQETKIRRFWARRPASEWRYLPMRRLYPYLGLDGRSLHLLKPFYGAGLDDPLQPAFSHLLRWTSTSRIWRFFSADCVERTAGFDPVTALLETMPSAFRDWRPLARAQYLEMRTLLSSYLLSAQGDRMLMGHSVEGRFPFLDHRLVQLAARLPDAIKLHVLDGKRPLKEMAAALLPADVVRRPKLPYRSPAADALIGPAAAPWTSEAFDADAIDSVHVFDARKVEALRAKLAAGHGCSEWDGMALTAIASVQLLDREVVRRDWTSLPGRGDVAIVNEEACDAGRPVLVLS